MHDRSIKFNFAANIAGQAYCNVMTIAFLPVYISLLGPQAYGLIGIYSIIQASLSVIDMGLAPALAREAARSTTEESPPTNFPVLLRSVEWLSIGTSLAITISSAIVSIWWANSWSLESFLTPSAFAFTITLMTLLGTTRLTENIYRNCLVGFQRHVALMVQNCIVVTARTAGAVAVLSYISCTITSFFLWQCFVSSVSIATMAALVYQTPGMHPSTAKFSWDELRGLFRFGRGLFAITLLTLLLTQCDKMILSRMLPLEEFGYYAFAVSCAAALNSLVGPVAQTWYPRLTQLYAQNKRPEFLSAYHLASQSVTVVLGSASIILICYSDIILALWTQDAALTNKLRVLLSLLAFGNLLNGLMWIPYHAQLAAGNTQTSIRLNTVAVAILLPLLFILVPKYGTFGAAFAWISLNVIYIALGINIMHRTVLRGQSLQWYWRDTSLPLIGALAIALALRTVPIDHDSLLQMLTLLLGAGSCTIIACGLAADRVRPAAFEIASRIVAKIA